MNIIERALYWVFDRLFGGQLKALTIEELQEERAFLASEIAVLRKRKKKHSHLLPALQHATNELIRLGG